MGLVNEVIECSQILLKYVLDALHVALCHSLHVSDVSGLPLLRMSIEVVWRVPFIVLIVRLRLGVD